MSTKPVHPYFPRGLKLKTYVASTLTLGEILWPFFGAVAVVLLISLFVSRRLKVGQRLSVCWFVLCGFIHCGLEGYFAWTHAYIGSKTDYLAEVWKEYAKGDSRYMISDPFTVSMETITSVFWGPLSFVAAFGIIAGASWRRPLQMLISIGQLYGCVLYFATEYLEHFAHGDTSNPLYFWFYFVFMNAVWIVVPLAIIFTSWAALVRAQAVLDVSDAKKRT